MSSKPTRVLQHHYNALTQKWSKVQSEIQIDDQPFAEGAFRAAYNARMSWEGQSGIHFVCKFAKDPSTPRTMYFNDVEAHEIATLYTRKFNEHLPEKYPRIGYVPAFIVEFVDRPGRPVCGCEMRLDGKFKKYNNNVGAVCAMSNEEMMELAKTTSLINWDPTSTAQAFSHFSYEHSSNQVLICDIQGVENRFTDPQIHTISGKGFGLGNLGQTGIRAFLLRHTCTDLCRAVGLTEIKAKDLNERTMVLNNNFSHTSSLPTSAAAASTSASSAALSSSAHPHRRPPPSQPSSSSSSDVLVLSDSPPSLTPSSNGVVGRSLSSSASTAYLSHQASQAVMMMRPPTHTPVLATSTSFSAGSPSLSAALSSDQQEELAQHQQTQQQFQQIMTPSALSARRRTNPMTGQPMPTVPTATGTVANGPIPSSTSSSLPSRQSSTQSTPTHSPSPSPSPAQVRASDSRTGSPPPIKKIGLDDSDEALMASIMGD